MKVSFVTIALNEEKRIDAFLQSLSSQRVKPGEIVFVDNGSRDKTVEKVKKSGLCSKLLIKSGISIAKARNLGVKHASNDIIAMADSDCILQKDWIRFITAPFCNNEIDIVAGFYKKTGSSILQKCLSPYYGVSPDKFNHNFLPATCSIAFRKQIWHEIGGFSETLERAGEDTLFNYQAIKLGAKIKVVPKAIVDWEVPQTLVEATRKFYYYAKGDAQTRIWWHPKKRFSTHNLKIILIFVRYLVGLTLLFFGFFYVKSWYFLATLILFYLLWAIVKNYYCVKKWQAIFFLPLIQIISDFCVMIGFVAGITKII